MKNILNAKVPAWALAMLLVGLLVSTAVASMFVNLTADVLTVSTTTTLNGNVNLGTKRFNSPSAAVVAKTANYIVAATDCGKTFTNLGATANTIYNLPAATLNNGCMLSWMVMAAQNTIIKPGTGDMINSNLTTTIGNSISSNTKYTTLTLQATPDGQWLKKSAVSATGLVNTVTIWSEVP